MKDHDLDAFFAHQRQLRHEAYMRWRVERYSRFMPEPEPVICRYPPNPAHWDEGQLAENELPSWSEWKAIDAAHALMRPYFPRMTPPPSSKRVIDRTLAPSPKGRVLPPMDPSEDVNFEAAERAIATLSSARMLTEGAVFVGRDANYAIMVSRHAAKHFFVAFFDSGVTSPWLTRLYEDQGYAVDAVSGWQMYLF